MRARRVMDRYGYRSFKDVGFYVGVNWLAFCGEWLHKAVAPSQYAGRGEDVNWRDVRYRMYGCVRWSVEKVGRRGLVAEGARGRGSWFEWCGTFTKAFTENRAVRRVSIAWAEEDFRIAVRLAGRDGGGACNRPAMVRFLIIFRRFHDLIGRKRPMRWPRT